MGNCNYCKNATHDCFSFYGTTQKQWFVDGCKKCDEWTDEVFEQWESDNLENIDCPFYEEYENGY